MAEMTIRLEIDPQTGKKNVIVKLRHDDALLPHEHEREHRSLVEKLLERGIVGGDELGELIVERESEEPSKTKGEERSPAERQSQAEGQ